jgi:hypothetical protein
MLFLSFLFIFHYYSLFTDQIIDGYKKKEFGLMLGGIIEISFVIAAILFTII